MAGDFSAVFHLDDVVLVFGANTGDALGKELRAKAIGLKEGPLAELFAGETFGEAEIVFDAGAGARLAARSDGLDNESA